MQKINREKFLNNLELLAAGLSRKAIIEQSNCFIFTDDGIITFNGEVSCKQRTDIGIRGALQAGPLLALLKKIPDEELTVAQKDEKEISFVGINKKITLRCEANVSLPIETVESPGKWKELPETFAEAVDIIKECASQDESKFVLTCLHLTSEWIEATDGYQAARFVFKEQLETESILLRKTSLDCVLTLNATHYSETDSWFHFKGQDKMVFSMRKHVEEYPDIKKVFSLDGCETILLPKGISEAAERADVLVSELDKTAMITLTLNNNKLGIKGEGPSGSYREVKKIKYEGEPFSFLSSAKLIQRLVKRYDECEINSEKIRVKGTNFAYVCALGTVNNGEA